MNNTLEWILKHPIKSAGIIGTGILLLTNTTKAQERLEGIISDPITQQGLYNQQIDLELSWDGQTITDTMHTTTNINGYYVFDNITGIEDEQSPNNKTILKYYGNKIFTNNFDEKTLKIYTTNGQEVKSIKTSNPNIDINLEGLASGRYLTVVEIDKKAYANLIIADAGKIIGYKKLEDTIKEEKNNKLNKITEVWGRIKIQDPGNTHHTYFSNTGNWSGQRTLNITLPPVIPLQTPFTDPEVSYPINNLMDLWKYMARIQGPDDYGLYAKTLWPIKIYIDSCNAPTEWITPIRNAIQFKRNNTTLNPDSVLIETNEYTDPFSGQNFSAVFLIYTDSLDIGQQDTRIGFFYDQNQEAFTGAYFKINTTTGMQPIDIYKAIQRNLQKYITQTGNQINNPNYLGTETRGAPYETTPDEQKLEDMIRNMSPKVWINRFFNPGTLYKPGAPNGFERKGQLLIPKENIIKN